jgi:hypothetical protein
MMSLLKIRTRKQVEPTIPKIGTPTYPIFLTRYKFKQENI